MYLGANTSSYSILSTAIRNAGRYYCQVDNQYGTAHSGTAIVTVTEARRTSVISEATCSKDLPLKQKSSNVPQIKDFTSSAELES